MVNTVLPFLFSYPLRIFRPDLELAIDGSIWILTCYTLIRLLKPDTNWVCRQRTQLRRVVEAAEGGADTTSPEQGREGVDHNRIGHSGDERSFFARWFSTSKPNWQPRSEIPPPPTIFPHSQPPSSDDPSSSRLPRPAHEEDQQRQPLLTRLNPPTPKHSYGLAGSTGHGESTSRNGKTPDPERRPLISGDDEEGESVHAAVIQGSNGTGENVLYAQDGPMAPAWVLHGIAKGHVGAVEDLQGG